MWNSKHIFIHDFQLIDVYLSNELFPLIKEFGLSDWFYIRYWQGGPHIRLRYNMESDKQAAFELRLINSVKEFERVHGDRNFQEINYDERNLKLEKVEELTVYPNFSVQSIPYIAEYERYGGKRAIAYSERLFTASSELAINIMNSVNWPKRYVIAFDLMYYSFQIAKKLGLVQSDEQFFRSYHHVWDSFDSEENPYIRASLEERKEKISNREDVPKAYQHYLDELKLAFDEIILHQHSYKPENLYYIMISHIHMLNNRLGISPENEYFLSGIYLKERESIHEAVEL